MLTPSAGATLTLRCCDIRLPFKIALRILDVQIGIPGRCTGHIHGRSLDLQRGCAHSGGDRANLDPLKIKNYDELRPADFLVPRILIVVVVPDSLTDWLNHSEVELAMRRCGYWLSLLGMPATTNTASVTVHLPRIKQFTVVELQAMMQRIGSGGHP